MLAGFAYRLRIDRSAPSKPSGSQIITNLKSDKCRTVRLAVCVFVPRALLLSVTPLSKPPSGVGHLVDLRFSDNLRLHAASHLALPKFERDDHHGKLCRSDQNAHESQCFIHQLSFLIKGGLPPCAQGQLRYGIGLKSLQEPCRNSLPFSTVLQ